MCRNGLNLRRTTPAQNIGLPVFGATAILNPPKTHVRQKTCETAPFNQLPTSMTTLPLNYSNDVNGRNVKKTDYRGEKYWEILW